MPITWYWCESLNIGVNNLILMRNTQCWRQLFNIGANNLILMPNTQYWRQLFNVGAINLILMPNSKYWWQLFNIGAANLILIPKSQYWNDNVERLTILLLQLNAIACEVPKRMVGGLYSLPSANRKPPPPAKLTSAGSGMYIRFLTIDYVI